MVGSHRAAPARTTQRLAREPADLRDGDRRTVLHVLAPAEFGGLEAIVRALAVGHAERGHDVHVAAVLNRREHPFPRAFEGTGVRVWPVAVPPRRYLRERAALATLLRRLRPEVVHTHGYRADVMCGLLAGGLGFRTVSTVHGFTGGDLKNRFYETAQCHTLARLDAVVAVSRPLSERLLRRGVPRDRLHVVQNAWCGGIAGPSLSSRKGRPSRSARGFRIGWVGRLSREKGPDLLLRALARLGGPDWEAVVIGDGPERRSLRSLASSLGLGDRIEWAGAVEGAAELFQGFDAFVLSSRTEGTPVVLFEAMAAGVPVVATRVGGVPDVVTCAEAILVEPENPAALAAALRTIRGDREGARKRARAARRRLADDFGSDGWLDRYEDIYRSIHLPTPVTAV